MNKTFIILSMHRSASSLVARALHICGVHMGDRLLKGLPDNPEGHYEDVDFIEKNIELLGGDNWQNPDTVVQGGDTSDLIRKKNNKKLWGFKDPRTALTIDKYYHQLDDPIIVALFRKPGLVGESLERRGDMDKERGARLARQYNKKIIDFLTKEFL